MIYLFIFLVNTVYIAGRAFQQLNVMHHKRMWMVWTSLILASAEVCIYGGITYKAIATLESGEWWRFALLALPLWLGGATGTLISMELHKRLR